MTSDPGGARFLVALNHDMRNALGAVSAAAVVLAITLGPHESASANEALGIIFRQTRAMASLLDDLVQAARGHPPVEPIHPGGVDQAATAEAADIDSLPPSRRRTVLVVQEDPALLAALCTALRLDRHTVVGATNGIDGLAELLASRPDVSIVGLGPCLPAFEFAGHARAAGYAGRMVVLSATVSAGCAQDALAAGFDACLSLPVERRTLRASLEFG